MTGFVNKDIFFSAFDFFLWCEGLMFQLWSVAALGTTLLCLQTHSVGKG